MGIYIINLIVLFGFLLSCWQDRRKISNGLFFLILLVCSVISLINVAINSQNELLLGIISLGIIVLIGTVFFGSVVVMFVSFFQGIRIVRKEGLKKTNLLSLILGVVILAWLVTQFWIMPAHLSNNALIVSNLGINLILGYLVVFFLIYNTASAIYRFYRPIRKIDYIIVLGAGLLRGSEVSPLLMSRVNRAIQLYRRQINKQPITLIMSGGQGEDEDISEAEAMRIYALTQGVNEEDIYIEDQSKNTYQNMLYAKQMIDSIRSKKKVRVLFVTTNYHVFRAGIYAKKAGLKAQGIGAKTPFYFWYNAMLREFAAILSLYRRESILIFIMIIIILGSGIYIINNPNLITQVLELYERIIG